jgi:hypothetical protein
VITTRNCDDYDADLEAAFSHSGGLEQVAQAQAAVTLAPCDGGRKVVALCR